MNESTINIIFEIDIDLVKQVIICYLMIGLIFLFFVVHLGLKDQNEKNYMASNLGLVVMTILAFWPYSLICLIFSWPGWFMSIDDLFKNNK